MTNLDIPMRKKINIVARMRGKARLDANEEMNVKISAAIYLIESVSDDINMPAHARTQIWAIMSALESF
ncbi:UPF0147 family protein [Candidatus Micrarchaeota archaeon]|nr:UPF0147 family protein [Candidatus Micrarchaeota archaeon]